MNTIISGLLIGAGFGFVLERAGFGNPNKLTAQFKLKDWTVFKVMFTAIVFTSVGLMLLEYFGFIEVDNLFIPPSFLGAAAIGGTLLGAGFAVGGYCPGTSVVGFVSGRIDAAIFLLGLLLGTVIFSGAFSYIESWTGLGEYSLAITLPQYFHVSDWVINGAMIIAAVGIFLLGGWLEKKLGGPVCLTNRK